MTILKFLTMACYLLFAAGVALWVVEIWTPSFLPPDVFAKLILSDIALFIVLFALAFLIREHRTSSTMNKLDS